MFEQVLHVGVVFVFLLIHDANAVVALISGDFCIHVTD